MMGRCLQCIQPSRMVLLSLVLKRKGEILSIYVLRGSGEKNAFIVNLKY